jgi:hypothetical protein
MKNKITIIGAGSVGANAALFLDKLGFDVTLIESADDILDGAPQATFITHGDGFEYHKAGHQKTGESCIDGAITKQLLYPARAFQTGVCNAGNPIRFMVSNESLGKDGLTLDSFRASILPFSRREDVCSPALCRPRKKRTAWPWYITPRKKAASSQNTFSTKPIPRRRPGNGMSI